LININAYMQTDRQTDRQTEAHTDIQRRRSRGGQRERPGRLESFAVIDRRH